MTRDEQRQAWRVYAAAALQACGRIGLSSAEIVNSDDIKYIGAVAAALTAEELRRYNNARDHSGDADKMVEPRPWVSLTAIERIDLRGWFNRHDSATIDDLLIYHDEMLRANNRGTR